MATQTRSGTRARTSPATHPPGSTPAQCVPADELVHDVLEDWARNATHELVTHLRKSLAEARWTTRKDAQEMVAFVIEVLTESTPRFLEQQFLHRFLCQPESTPRSNVVLAHLLLRSAVGMLPPEKANTSSLDHSKASASTVRRETSDKTGSDKGEMLTSEEAAKLLHVSRTHLNTLVDSGVLGTTLKTKGGHRRISKAAVMEYRAASKTRRAKAFDKMVDATERLGLYDAELDGIPRRTKR